MKADAYERVMAGLQEALADSEETPVLGLRLSVLDDIDVAAIRKRTGLSQAAFSGRIGVPVSTLRNWEQRRRRPEGPARVLLAMLKRNPKIVEEILAD